MEPLEITLYYHQRTKHDLGRFAASLGYLDWANQPDPFRRFRGSPCLELDEVPVTEEPAYEGLFSPAVAAKPFDRRGLC